MTTSSLPAIESWVPLAVANVAARLHAEFTKANSEEGLTSLTRLVSDQRMRNVWRLLYSKKRHESGSTEVFAYPAIITFKARAAHHRRQACELRAKGGESNECEADFLNFQAELEERLPELPGGLVSHEQDYAVGRVFDFACRAAIDITPTYSSDIETSMSKVAAVGRTLREQQTQLCELGLWEEANKLGEVIDQCDDLLDLQFESYYSDSPIIIRRKRGDPKIRAYVAQLYELSFDLFGTPLYGTLATIANVVFDGKTVTRQMVQDWLS
jgi:hypothetical protein